MNWVAVKTWIVSPFLTLISQVGYLLMRLPNWDWGALRQEASKIALQNGEQQLFPSLPPSLSCITLFWYYLLSLLVLVICHSQVCCTSRWWNTLVSIVSSFLALSLSRSLLLPRVLVVSLCYQCSSSGTLERTCRDGCCCCHSVPDSIRRWCSRTIFNFVVVVSYIEIDDDDDDGVLSGGDEMVQVSREKVLLLLMLL